MSSIAEPALAANHSWIKKLELRKFYINGAWIDPVESQDFTVICPATEEPIATISLGGKVDVDLAVAAAVGAFESYSQTSVAERLHLLQRIVDVYSSRMEQMAQLISLEMGAPISLSRAAQAPTGLRHFTEAVSVLKSFVFEQQKGSTLMRKEPIGVCGLITPWNWPVNQIACKVAPALATGCAVVLKPSEFAPLSACLVAEILHEAGVPAGVFNLIHGQGPIVGQAIAAHPDVAMVSFTGSTRAGVAVAHAAAPTIKRVAQELGGKSANIILDDSDLEAAVKDGAETCFRNSGQSCNAPTRMLVPRAKADLAKEVAKRVADSVSVGDPFSESTALGPLATKLQFEKVQRLIKIGMDEGATLIAGGLGRPQGLTQGYFVKPTVFADVHNQMTIAREEVFGPVLSILTYEDEEDAVRIANDTDYGLSSYVVSGDIDRARRVAKRMRSGNVHINGAKLDLSSCFGGYKQSGNGREWSEAGFEEFLELKAILGFSA